MMIVEQGELHNHIHKIAGMPRESLPSVEDRADNRLPQINKLLVGKGRRGMHYRCASTWSWDPDKARTYLQTNNGNAIRNK